MRRRATPTRFASYLTGPRGGAARPRGLMVFTQLSQRVYGPDVRRLGESSRLLADTIRTRVSQRLGLLEALGRQYCSRGETKPRTDQVALGATNKLLHSNAILNHIAYAAAQHLVESGRPLDLFVDASDYGWRGVLGRLQSPHSARKFVISIAP